MENTEKEMDEDASISETSSALRVRTECEVNSTADVESEAVDENQTRKRKQPEWMTKIALNQEVDGTNEGGGCEESVKRCKLNVNGTNEEETAGPDNVASSDDSPSTSSVQVKEEPRDESNENNEIPTSDLQTSTNGDVNIKTEPEDKDEDTANDAGPSTSGVVNPTDVKPTVKVEKADATSTSRQSCKFGIRCYRRNPMHRVEEAHPGDRDYRRPSFPPPPAGTPMCPYGDQCYRRNPSHFEQYDHPPETDFAANYKNYRMRLRQRKAKQPTQNDSDSEDSLSDFFAGDDSDPDYDPSNDGKDDDDEFKLSDNTPVDD